MWANRKTTIKLIYQKIKHDFLKFDLEANQESDFQKSFHDTFILVSFENWLQLSFCSFSSLYFYKQGVSRKKQIK